MVIKEVSLGTGVIEISSDDNFGLTLYRNIKVSNEFDAAVAELMKTTHKVIRVQTSVSNN